MGATCSGSPRRAIRVLGAIRRVLILLGGGAHPCQARLVDGHSEYQPLAFNCGQGFCGHDHVLMG